MDVPKQPSRRSFLNYMAYAMGGIAVGASGLVMIDSMNPAADAWERDVTRVDLKNIKPGQRLVVVWRRMPIVIYHRTKKDIAEVRAEDWQKLRYPESDEDRVQKGHEQWLVLIGVCARNECVLTGNREGQPRGRWDGWQCPCCGSSYDRSGRTRNGPAPRNLSIPQYIFEENDSLKIGGKPITRPVGR